LFQCQQNVFDIYEEPGYQIINIGNNSEDDILMTDDTTFDELVEGNSDVDGKHCTHRRNYENNIQNVCENESVEVRHEFAT
jgi:hypothetical protein